MLYPGHQKTPADVARVQIDLRDFVAEVSPDPVTFILRVQQGISVTEVSNVAGLIDVDVSGGVMGLQYIFGYEGRTTGGLSDESTHRMRIVDMSEISGLVVSSPADLAVITETGDVLVTETGDTIAWS